MVKGESAIFRRGCSYLCALRGGFWGAVYLYACQSPQFCCTTRAESLLITAKKNEIKLMSC